MILNILRAISIELNPFFSENMTKILLFIAKNEFVVDDDVQVVSRIR